MPLCAQLSFVNFYTFTCAELLCWGKDGNTHNYVYSFFCFLIFYFSEIRILWNKKMLLLNFTYALYMNKNISLFFIFVKILNLFWKIFLLRSTSMSMDRTRTEFTRTEDTSPWTSSPGGRQSSTCLRSTPSRTTWRVWPCRTGGGTCSLISWITSPPSTSSLFTTFHLNR